MIPAAKCNCRFANVQNLFIGIAAVFGVMLSASPAQSAGWSLDTKVSERIVFDDNIQLLKPSPGVVYGSITSLSTDLAWQAPRLDMNFITELDFNRYWGPGSVSSLNTFDRFHKADIHKKGKTVDIDLTSTFRVQDTTNSEREDTGITTQTDNQRLTFSVGGDTSYKVNDRLTLSFSSTANYTDFTKQSAALTPFIDIDVEGGLTRKLTNATDVSMFLSWGLFAADDLADTTSHTYKATGRMTTILSPRLTAKVSVGTTAIRTDKKAGLVTSASSKTNIGGVLDVGLDYKLRTTQYSLSATQDFEPSASGEIQQRTKVNISVSHQINHRSSLSFTASGSSQKSLSGGNNTTRNFFTVAPTYSYLVARNWNATFGYTFELQDTKTTKTSANAVFISLTRTLSLLP